ncbi:hypothetical protein DPMN_108696 [Dreissena polymorpha]|uniref:Uncharacterized protein n=1 Tax=Dreissena polymorpha TaxID=45954 RepID=A0A9D4K9B5_DREPO|nr:hypothetical protein DPMN_108696 [Dreissena polymorpha]
MQSLYLVEKLMELLVQNLFSLAIAEVAMAILIRTAVVLVPPLNRVAPKYWYLKLVTSSSFSPFIVMSALVLVVLFYMIFDFSMLTYVLYAHALS